MNLDEKILARILFQNKIYQSDGQNFEDLFCKIMAYFNPNFRKIKPYGNIGDRKNDAYIENIGVYYQVYAPENIVCSYPAIIKKIKTDFLGLIEHWKNINEFYFVLNDKYKGVNADAEMILSNLKIDYNLKNSGFICANNLEQILFELSDDKISTIIGFLPNIDKITNIDFSVLSQVINFIIELPLKQEIEQIKYPDWDEKIKFNNLHNRTKLLLNNGSQTLGALNKFLAKQSFLSEALQNKMIAVYNSIKKDWTDLPINGENIFWEILERCSPINSKAYKEALIVILSKYFESCDIFEEPIYGS